MNEFEAFTRRQELERAIMKAADLLETGDYDPVEKLNQRRSTNIIAKRHREQITLKTLAARLEANIIIKVVKSVLVGLR